MKKEQLPTTFPGIIGEVYAGFWIRTAAKLLDFMTMLPLMAFILYIDGLSKSAYFYLIIPNLIFYVWFEVYLVKRYGGTPGKLIMGIKIVRMDGDEVDWHAAAMRYLVNFCVTILGIIVMVWTLNMIDNDTYTSLGFFKRSQFMSTLNPIPFKVQTWISGIWTLSGIIVLLSNKRKCAVHDFIAGTVVIRTVYLNKIREIILPTTIDSTEV